MHRPILLLTLLAPALAFAQAPTAPHDVAPDELPPVQMIRVAVLPLKAPGGLDAARLSAAMAEELRECNLYRVLTDSERTAGLETAGRNDLADCHAGTCLNEVHQALGVNRVVSGTITTGGGGWIVAVETVGGPPDEEPRAELHWTGEEEGLEHVVRAATQLAALPRAWREPGGVALQDLPKGATVYVDGRALQANSRGVVGPLPVGTHDLLVEHPDYQDWKQPLVLRSGELLELASGLEETQFYHEWWFWAALAAGVAVAVIVPVAIVLQPDDSPGHKVPAGDLDHIELGVVRW